MATQIKSYKDLIAWKLAVELSLAVYRCSRSFPSDERFGLTSQIRRAGVSIPSNIAEGYGRGGAAEYARFLRIARGSLFELETQLVLAVQLEYLDQERFEELEDKSKNCGRVLAGLLRSIESHKSG